MSTKKLFDVCEFFHHIRSVEVLISLQIHHLLLQEVDVLCECFEVREDLASRNLTEVVPSLIVRVRTHEMRLLLQHLSAIGYLWRTGREGSEREKTWGGGSVER